MRTIGPLAGTALGAAAGVVVDNARRFIGKDLEVTVTSAIQTSAGRMIFAQCAPRESVAAGVEAAP